MTTQTDYRGRFAPSPTGPLHLGSLLAALGSWLMARRTGGAWLVRIEDLDPPREVPGAADLQLHTLAACGLESDGPVVYQSQRGHLYQAALDRLLETGAAFACRCSRRDLAPSGGIHRRCVDDPSGRSDAIRLRAADAGELCFDDALQGLHCEQIGRAAGDFVVRRSDGLWAYQLAVVVDDAEQRITDVVRGLDLIDSTPRQILLQQTLALPTPRYLHLPLVRDASGAKLSKSLGSLAVDADDPMPALRAAWAMLGQSPVAGAEPGPAAVWTMRMVDRFDPGALPAAGSSPDPATTNSGSIAAVTLRKG